MLVSALTKRGHNDDGEIGEFRKTIHGINEHISEIDYLTAILLKIRKDEKDYLLRQDLKYQKKLKRNVEKLKKRISADNQIDNDTKSELIDELDIYYEAFSHVIEIDKKIGFTANEGLQKEFRDAIHQVKPAILNLVKIFTNESEKKSKKTFIQLRP